MAEKSLMTADDEPAEKESPWTLAHAGGMFVAGAKDFGEDAKAAASGSATNGPSMKHRLQYLKDNGLDK